MHRASAWVLIWLLLWEKLLTKAQVWVGIVTLRSPLAARS